MPTESQGGDTPPAMRAALGPLFYGALIGTGSNPTGLFIGYVVGGAIMVLGGIVELLIGDQGRRQIARERHQTADVHVGRACCGTAG